MVSDHRLSWMRLCGVVAMAMFIFALLMLPAEWERPTTGHWFIEHFLGLLRQPRQLSASAWGRPLVVAPSRASDGRSLYHSAKYGRPVH